MPGFVIRSEEVFWLEDESVVLVLDRIQKRGDVGEDLSNKLQRSEGVQ